MLGISFAEFIIIVIAAFLIIGPTRLESSSRELGRFIRRCKDHLSEIKTTHLKDIDTTAFYEAKVELGKSLSEISRHE